MASRSTGLACTARVKASWAKRSGAQSTSRTSPRSMRAMASCISRPDCRLVTIATGRPAAARRSCWSWMSAMSGLTTTVRPPDAKAGAWKHSDLPDPVGITTRLSAPASAASIGRSCPGRRDSTPICPSTSRSARGAPPRGGAGASRASRRARRGAAMRPRAALGSPCISRQSSRRASSRRSAVEASSGAMPPAASARATTMARSATGSTGRCGMALTGGRG